MTRNAHAPLAFIPTSNKFLTAPRDAFGMIDLNSDPKRRWGNIFYIDEMLRGTDEWDRGAENYVRPIVDYVAAEGTLAA